MNKMAIFLLLATSFALGFIVCWSFYKPAKLAIPQEVMKAANLSSKGFVEVEIDVSPNTIRLRSDCSELLIYTSKQQIASIRRALRGGGGRPFAHDLLGDVMKGFKIKLIQTRVWKLERKTYYARLLLRLKNRILNLDARPSDAIAIAARLEKPVLVKQSLLDEYGRKIC